MEGRESLEGMEGREGREGIEGSKRLWGCSRPFSVIFDLAVLA